MMSHQSISPEREAALEALHGEYVRELHDIDVRYIMGEFDEDVYLALLHICQEKIREVSEELNG